MKPCNAGYRPCLNFLRPLALAKGHSGANPLLMMRNTGDVSAEFCPANTRGVGGGRGGPDGGAGGGGGGINCRRLAMNRRRWVVGVFCRRLAMHRRLTAGRPTGTLLE